MRFEEFKRQIGVPLFDTAFARQALRDYGSDGYLAVQFSRWVAEEKLIKLRRGLYAVADVAVSPFAVANHLVEPSYISGEFAMSWYGLIPEAAWTVVSACIRAPRTARWENLYGVFRYRQVKLYEGFHQMNIQGVNVSFAEAEKALLDCWYWQPGEWSEERHQSMRYQDLEQIDLSYLKTLSKKFHSPRLSRSVQGFLPVYNALMEKNEETHSA